MENWFRALFKSSTPKRDKYVARLLGLFSEDIVRIWCAAPQSPYRDLGRPRVIVPPNTKGHNLDFTLQSNKDGCTYVAEMKCWVETHDYQYLTLHNAEQLRSYKDEAFRAFLAVAREPARYKVLVGKKPQQVCGAILIWGDVAQSGIIEFQQKYHVITVLSLREIVEDLVTWKGEHYQAFLEERSRWCRELFGGLARPGNANAVSECIYPTNRP